MSTTTEQHAVTREWYADVPVRATKVGPLRGPLYPLAKIKVRLVGGQRSTARMNGRNQLEVLEAEAAELPDGTLVAVPHGLNPAQRVQTWRVTGRGETYVSRGYRLPGESCTTLYVEDVLLSKAQADRLSPGWDR